MQRLADKFLRRKLPRSLRVGLSIAVILVCLWGALKAWRVGASRLLTYHGRAARLLGQTERAVNETPDDPEAHSGRAYVLLNTGKVAAALPEYETAVALRPRDYFLWLELGRARDMNEDEQGSLMALEQAVRLAPEYAQPRWQLGNVLFRNARVEEAFLQLRKAAVSDPALLPRLIDLSWGASGEDAVSTEQIIQPERASWRIALAKFFVRHGRITEALAQFRLAGGISGEDRQSLLDDLLAAKRYREAYEVWAVNSGDDKQRDGIAQIIDGGFENKVSRSSAGFGWQLTPDTDGLRVSLERVNPHSGTQSLRVDFNGDANPGQLIMSQLILVEPDTRYSLRFSVRMEEIVTGGLPILEVRDADSLEGRTFTASPPLQPNFDGWREYTIDLTTAKTTSALRLSLHRQNCSSGPCPIFGRLWLDDFLIQKLSGN
jgi:tetratricopeptide (TPR) repeat protein